MAERIQFQSKSGKQADGEIVFPKNADKAPAVIVVQEYWGLNDHIRSLLARLADEGFVAFAPDLYHGKITKDAGEAAKLMGALSFPQAIDEIAGATAFLAKHARTNGSVGIIGFCLGGAITFAAAANIPELKAAVPFYGVPEKVDFSNIKAPVQAHFAKVDQWASQAKAEAMKHAIEGHGGKMELHIYDAGHAFVNDTRPEAYVPAAAKQAWERATKFLHHQLG